VQLLDAEGKKYIQIKVNPYTVPVSLRGRYYYRSGSTKLELTGLELNGFLLKKAGKTWDDIIEESADFSDIETKSVEAFKKEAAATIPIEDIGVVQPTETKQDKKNYTDFRKKMQKDGFTMFQFSAYLRHCSSRENAEVHVKRVQRNLPPKGHVGILTVTDKQFGMMQVFFGGVEKEKAPVPQQLELF